MATATANGAQVQDSGFLFKQLTDRLKSKPADVQQRILAHIRETTGHSTLPAFVNNGCTEETKVQVLKDCLLAILRNDYSNLKGEVPNGQARAPQDAPEPKPSPNGGPGSKNSPPQAPGTAGGVKIVSYKVGVKTKGDANWCYNALRFSTEAEAKEYGSDLHSRWMAVESWEVHPSEDPVTARWSDGRGTTDRGLVHLPKPEEKPAEPESKPEPQPADVADKAEEDIKDLGIGPQPDPRPTNLIAAAQGRTEYVPEPAPAPDDKMAAVVAALKGLVQQPTAAVATVDEAKVEAIVRRVLLEELRKLQDYVEGWCKNSIEAQSHGLKYDLLRLMDRRYEQHKKSLAAAIEEAK